MKKIDNPYLTNRSAMSLRPTLLNAAQKSFAVGSVLNSCKYSHSVCMLITSGSGCVVVDECVNEFKTGDLIVLNCEVVHSLNFTGDEPCEFWTWAFDNLKIEGLLPNTLLKDKPFCLVACSHYSQLQNLISAISYEQMSIEPFNQPIGAYLIRTLLLFVLRAASQGQPSSIRLSGTYLQAKEYLDNHFTTIDSLDEVCKRLFINKFYLTHIFKEQMGIPPVQYLIHKRIELACEKLISSEDNINDIAKSCGYTDAGYFCRVFKNVQKVTPLQYRYNYKQSKKQKLMIND